MKLFSSLSWRNSMFFLTRVLSWVNNYKAERKQNALILRAVRNSISGLDILAVYFIKTARNFYYYLCCFYEKNQ